MNEILVENEIVMKKVSEIRPYEKNPRNNEETVEKLCEIIPKAGFNVPLVIDSNGVIVKGDARFKAAKKLGMKEVPCIITHADEEAVKADRIADNKASEFSEWMEEGVMHEVDMLDVEFDISTFGLPSVREASDFEIGEVTFGFVSDSDNKEITSQKAIENAIEKQNHVVGASKEYVVCICEKCGEKIYLKK